MRKATWLAGSAAGLLSLGALTPSAWADLKLEQTTTSSGMAMPGGGGAKSTTVKSTLYYKGGKHRIDGDNSITIFDAESGKVTIIDTKNKTYYETTLTGMIPADASSAFASMVEFKGDVTVTDAKEDKQVSGKTAHHYKYVMTIKMMPKPSAPPTLAAILPTVEISADQWNIDNADAALAASKLSMSNMIQRMPMGMGEALKPMAEKMAVIKGVPVEMTQSMKMIPNPSAPEEMKAQAPKDPMVSTTKTTILSEAAIPDATFAVPEGYKKIEQPKTALPGA